MKKESGDTKAAESSGISFVGNFQHTLDDKGRVSIPSAFRQTLSQRSIGNLVLTNFISDGARCLEAYPEDEWKKFSEKLREKSRFDPQLQKLENFFLARAVVCPVDGSGRINVPQHLRNYAGFQKEVVFTSSLRGFRIWDQRVWELVFQDAEALLLENPALFQNLDL